MRPKVLLILITVIAGGLLWAAFQARSNGSMPGNAVWLDKIDIKTDNPQQAGKNTPAIATPNQNMSF